MQTTSEPFGLAARADADAILALYRSRIGSPGCTWSEDYPDGETLEEDLTRHELFVARDPSGAVAAVLTVSSEPDLDLPFWDPAIRRPFEPMRLGVRSDLQGQGYAHRLFRYAIEKKKAESFDGLRFLVSPGNPRALALYQKMGFQNVGEADLFGHRWHCYEGRI